MKLKHSFFINYRVITFLLVIFTSLSIAQTKTSLEEPVPENFYVTPVGLSSWDYMNNDDLQFYKMWLDGVFIADVDSNFYQYDGEELVAGESYFAEIQACYNSGFSDKVGYEFTYLPCDSFPGFNILDAENPPGTADLVLMWSDMAPMELIQMTQNPGDPSNGNYQDYGYGYGVAYNFSSYPDALINSIDFHHTSWGTYGTWDYMIHIIDWDTKTILASVGPFQSTGNDVWETGLELGDISTGGADSVAFLMEPMSNSSTDAYPCISCDGDSDSQGSIYGDLSDLNTMSSSTSGNFLMNAWIYTYNGNGKETNELTSIGANIYIEDEFVAFVPEPDTFYIIEEVPPGYYDYCVTKVYTEDDGEHRWTSCLHGNCIQDAGYPEECNSPYNLTGLINGPNNNYVRLNWNSGSSITSEWLYYDSDNILYDGIGTESSDYSIIWANKFSPLDLAVYSTGFVRKVAVYQVESASDYLTEVRILSGYDGSTVLYTQDVTGTLEPGWNEIELTSAVPFSNYYHLWIAMYAERPGDTYNEPMSGVLDVITNRYDFFAYNGSEWTTINNEYGINDVGWMLRGFISTSATGKSIALEHSQDDTRYSNYKSSNPINGKMKKADSNLSNTKFNPKETTEFLGYNIYRDGNLLNEEIITDTLYIDGPLDWYSYYCYEVTEVRTQCESEPSNEICVYYYDGLEELNNKINVYPNPAHNYIIVQSSAAFQSIKITNYLGQLIYSNHSINSLQKQIQTVQWNSGVYFIEVETEINIDKIKLIIQ